MNVPSGLCVGLDPDVSRIPAHIAEGDKPLQTFLAAIIDSTREFAAAYKINTAFFEQYGRQGIDAMYDVRAHVGNSFCIIDAKRGDIGNTSAAYAVSLFSDLEADAVTVAPYMGSDSVEPFLAFPDKLVYVLALTSNPGSSDFQRILIKGKPLYRTVIETALQWQKAGGLGFVVGANRPSELAELRSAFPEVPFLVPGIGAQGASEAEIIEANDGGPALFNMSRAILYASGGEDFAEKAAFVAGKFRM
jgi:orotidine-5'-phosphate decarboxylase